MFLLYGKDEFGEGDGETHIQSLQVVGPCSKTSCPKFQHRPPLTRKIKDLSLLGRATSCLSHKTGIEPLLVLEIRSQGAGWEFPPFPKPASGLVSKGDPCWWNLSTPGAREPLLPELGCLRFDFFGGVCWKPCREQPTRSVLQLHSHSRLPMGPPLQVCLPFSWENLVWRLGGPSCRCGQAFRRLTGRPL